MKKQRIMIKTVFFFQFFFSLLNLYSKTTLGLDSFLANKNSSLAAKHIGVILNQTSRTSLGEFSAKLFMKQKAFTVVAFFSPEHGFDGERKAGVRSDTLEKFEGVPIYSLYGATRKPTKKMLAGIDVLVFDMQDIGVRPYTFLSTMINAMEAAAENHIEFVVLDRPNPLGGLLIEGNILDSSLKSFVGIIPIPYIHGMTLGELAKMAKGEKWFKSAEKLKLSVVTMKGWKRSMNWAETGLPWTAPSPNIPTPESAMGAAMLGATGELGILSVGIGTDLPFQRIGSRLIARDTLFRYASEAYPQLQVTSDPFTAPFNDSIKTYNGVKFTLPVTENPFGLKPLYQDQFVLLQRLLHSDSNLRRSLAATSMNSKRMFEKVTGMKGLLNAIEHENDLAPLIAQWKNESEAFRKKRQPYLLYQ